MRCSVLSRPRAARISRVLVSVLKSVLVSVLGCFLLLCACSPSGSARNIFAYADGGFTVSVSGTFTRLAPDGYTGAPGMVGDTRTGVPQPIRATITVGAPAATNTPGEATAREMTVTFSAPDGASTATSGANLTGARLTGVGMAGVGMAGTTVSRAADGTVTLTRPSEFGQITMTGEHLAPFLRFAEALLPDGDITSVTPLSDGMRTVTVTSTDGRTATFTFSDGTLPTRVCVRTEAEVVDIRVEAIERP